MPLPVLTNTHLDRFIVVPEYNLLFCYIEKVGCTMFNKLFLRYVNVLESRNLTLAFGILIAPENMV